MAIPIRAVSTTATVVNLIGPLMEFARNEVQRIKDDFTTDPNEASFRAAPANVGFGLNVELDSTHEEGMPGYASDLNARLDFLTLPVNDNSPAPVHPTPAMHLTTDLRVYDLDGEQGWLHGGPLEANRLRSMETTIHWNRTGWDAELVLNDATHDGVVDWNADIPARQTLSAIQGQNYCIPECIQTCLSAHSGDWIQAGNEAQSFLATLETIGISSQTTDTNGNDVWVLNESNLTSLTQDADAYLNTYLTDPNTGDWNLDRILPSTGQTFFAHLCSRISGAELISDPNSPRDGSMCIHVPMRASKEGIIVYVKPEGSIELEVKSFPLAGSLLSGTMGFDFAGVQPASSTDGMTLTFDARYEFSTGTRGPFAGSYIHTVFDEANTTPERFTVDLHLPRLGKVLAPLNQLDQVDDGSATWVSTPDSIRLYPPPQVGNQSLVDFLSTTSPTVILETVLKTAIDGFVLMRFEDGCLLGEVMEVLDLVDQLPDGRYTCASLLDFARAPRAYLESIFILNSGVNVSKVLELAGAVLRAFDLPHRLQDAGGNIVENDNIAEVIFELKRGQDLPWAEIAVMVHPQNPNGITLAVRSPQVVGTPPPVHLEFDLRANLTPGPVFDIDGSTLSVTAYPYDLLDEVGSIATIFAQSSFIRVSAELIQGQIHVALDVNLDGQNTAHMTLLPTVTGVQSFFTSLLQSTTGSVLPNLLTLLLRELTGVTFGSQNQHDLGLILIGFFHDIDLWGPSANAQGAFLAPKVASIASDPRRWLLGPGTTGSDGWPFAGPALEDVIIGGIRAGCTIALPSSFWNSVDNSNTGENHLIFTLSNSPIIEIQAGRRVINNVSEFGIWFTVSEQVSLGNLTTLYISLIGGCEFETQTSFAIIPQAQLVATIADALVDESTLRVRPGVSLSWSPSQGFIVEAATDQKTAPSNDITWFENGAWVGSDKGFWIRWESLGTISKGGPSPGDLIAGALDAALGFIEGIEAVQEWLDSPLLIPNGTVIQASRPGAIADALQIMALSSNYTSMNSPYDSVNPKYEFADVKTVLSNWVSDPLACILDAAFGLVESEVEGASTPGILPLYTKADGDFNFQISLVDATPGPGQATFGIAFNFDSPPVIEMGKLRLQIFTQSSNEISNWTGRSFASGITLHLADWSTGGNIAPNISLEIAGVGAKLYRQDGKPILDKFFTLNTIEVALAMDANIFHLTDTSYPNIEFGGQLILDDFGIELGGGDSDGGNGMSKGLLSGGDDGKDAVKPIFDIAVSKYDSNPINIQMRGEVEYWFPINKEFGPVSIAQIGVKYWKDNSKAGTPHEHRLSVMVDGKAEVAGFLAQVDDLGVNFPLLRPLDFDDWQFELKGLAISYDKGSLKIAGALRKQESYAYFENNPSNDLNAIAFFRNPTGGQQQAPSPDPNSAVPVNWSWALQYAEYQGLCSIITPSFGLSAVGAFARVPKADGTGFVSCFIIAALDMPIGGPPFFFITGLMGGLGLNRELMLPEINTIDQNLFIQALSGTLASNPMAALDRVKSDFPVEHGSFWLALGVKFTSFQVIETKAVIFARFADDFTIGLIGLSSMDLPSPTKRIARVELGIMAYYDSGENVLWVQAQLTDNSYLFDTSCRLMGGFALVTWFNTGDFVLSLGGYHPRFQTPSHYPVVPRIGFSWKPTSALTIKGGVYFTLCSSAVMLGGGLEASYKKGKLSASFVAGMDVLVIFDPFSYDFNVYIGITVKYGRLGASLGADIHILGPKMHGTATVELLFVKFTVKFGNSSSKPPKIPFKAFVNKHVRQIDDENASVSGWLATEDWLTTTVTDGIIRSEEDDEMPAGTATDPWKVGPEFSLTMLTKFPNSRVITSGLLPATDAANGVNKDGQTTSCDPMVLHPTDITSIAPSLEISLEKVSPGQSIIAEEGLSINRRIGAFPATLWSSADPKSGAPPKEFLEGSVIKASALFEDGGAQISFEGNIEPCEMNMHLPFDSGVSPVNNMVNSLIFENNKPLDIEKDLSAFEAIISNQYAEQNRKIFSKEVEKIGGFRNKTLDVKHTGGSI